jgi:predicted house-cleaning noncanonical NTP pyrophosphatase (MazG superfamily)
MKNLYIFLDESGNFDFSQKGTKYFVICGYSTFTPNDLVKDIYDLRYRLLSTGFEQEHFHATEDKQFVRNEFFKIINKSNGMFDYSYIEKNKLNSKLQNKNRMYDYLVKNLLSKVLKNINQSGILFESVILIIDKVFTNSEKIFIKSNIRSRLKKFKKPYKIYFFQTKSDCNAQIADYGSWAKYVSLERCEFRSIDSIKHLIKSQ